MRRGDFVMKLTQRCPKCGSDDIIADATPIDRSHNRAQTEFSIATFRKPDAFLFKGQQSSNVSAWVCGACGFVEFYADQPQALKLPAPGTSD